jgi:hypothetical protein
VHFSFPLRFYIETIMFALSLAHHPYRQAALD